jgi:regulator of nonsense transcripts 1
MRMAISYLPYDPGVFEDASDDSEEFILQGTELRDVLLHSFLKQSPGEESGANNSESLSGVAEDLSWEDMGAFRNDQRIVSWARRYMKPGTVRFESDSPINLNESQMQAMAAMIGRRISLIQGVSIIFICLFLFSDSFLASRDRENENNYRNHQVVEGSLLIV